MPRTSKAPPAVEIEYERPWLYEKQRLAIFDCPDVNGKTARYGLTEASTKAGKTVACMAWLFEQALKGKPGQNFWWVAPVYPQAKIAFRRMRRGLPAAVFKANETEMTITLLNGAVIWFKSGEKPDNLYGEDVYAAVIDEASRVREDSFVAVRSTLTATRGPVRIIGNVKGRKNWFYRMCRRAEAGEPGMSFHKLTAYDAVAGGVLDASEIEDAKRQLPDHVFRELYLAEPSEDGGNPFGLSHIAACVAPLSAGKPVAIGIDLAKSSDWTVVIGLDRDARVCGFERWQAPWEVTVPRILDLVGRTPTLVDSTGVGDPIVERLQKERRNVFTGYHFSSSSKQKLMEGLAVAIQSRSLFFPEGHIRAELETFEYEYTRTGVRYTAPAGLHDDCVMALGLAEEHFRHYNPRRQDAKPVSVSRISPWLGGMSAEGDF
jgi:hypothetical protein